MPYWLLDFFKRITAPSTKLLYSKSFHKLYVLLVFEISLFAFPQGKVQGVRVRASIFVVSTCLLVRFLFSVSWKSLHVLSSSYSGVLDLPKAIYFEQRLLSGSLAFESIVFAFCFKISSLKCHCRLCSRMFLLLGSACIECCKITHLVLNRYA